MHQIRFYADKNGNKPVLEYLRELMRKKDKDSRIKADNINDCITALREYGTRIGMPVVRHLDGEIWELRPLSD